MYFLIKDAISYNVPGIYEVGVAEIWGGAKHRSRMSAVIRTRKGRSFAKQSGEFVHDASQLHMSFAQMIPEITTASIPPPGKVEALAKYKPFIGVLKYGLLTPID